MSDVRQRKPHNPGMPLMTDAEVLEARALHEFAEFSHAAIRARYGLARRYSQQLLKYETRSKLIPKPCHLPAGVRPVNLSDAR